MTAWDALLLAADRLDACPSAETVAAREVIARAVEHTRTCTACLPDPRLIGDLTALLGEVGDEQLDAAAVEIAVELDHRLTTATAHTSCTHSPPTSTNSTTSGHRIHQEGPTMTGQHADEPVPLEWRELLAEVFVEAERRGLGTFTPTFEVAPGRQLAAAVFIEQRCDHLGPLRLAGIDLGGSS